MMSNGKLEKCAVEWKVLWFVERGGATAEHAQRERPPTTMRMKLRLVVTFGATISTVACGARESGANACVGSQ